VTSTKEIRVAIVGVGNCANSLIQGVHYYKDAPIDQEIPGLMNVVVGGYHVKDVKFVAAFDVDSKKVGLDLVDAMWASENNTIKFADVPKSGITVLRGETHDGLGRYYKETISESTATPVNVVQALKDAKVDVLVCYLPVGSEVATKFYAQCAIDAGCAFVNALPVFIASTPEWADKFTKAGLPSWEMTLSPRSEQPSPTVSSPSYSRIVASRLIAPTSSMLVEIWTLRICWNAIVWNQRKFPRLNR
jgi:myo-inositol-1-phosphate synthase